MAGQRHKLLLERALNMRERHRAAVEPHVKAMVLLTAQTIVAGMARPRGRNGNKLADLQSLHICGQTGNLPRNLMAQHHRLTQLDRTKAAVVIVVQIRAANAARLHRNQNLAVTRRWHIARLDPQIAGGVDDN